MGPGCSPCPSQCLAIPTTSQTGTGKVLPHPILRSGEIIIFTNTFSMGFVGQESPLGLCRLERVALCLLSLGELLIRASCAHSKLINTPRSGLLEVTCLQLPALRT